MCQPAPVRMWQVRSKHAVPIAVAFALTLPLFVATVALYSEPWAPLYDTALIEQLVRDVGTTRTPLVGMGGRLGPIERPARHPGPLSFYMLAPVYRLLGGSAWGLQVSAAFLNAVALTAAVFIAWRRRNVAVVAAVGVGLALLMQGYGLPMLTEPWNPNFPVLWFAVFLVAGWSVACRDFAMLPVVVTAASICAQTHIAYVPVCGGLGTLAVIIAAVFVVRAGKGSEERRRGFRWIALSFALLVVLWLPPMIQELGAAPGNVSLLIRNFADPENHPIGVLQALPLVLSRFDLWHVVVDESIAPGSFAMALPVPSPEPWRGCIALLVWVLCAIGSIRLGSKPLLALHGLVLSAFGVALMATSRVIGYPYNHVMFWTWGLGVLLLVACLASIGFSLVRSCPPSLRMRLAPIAVALPVGCLALCSMRLAWAATDVRPMRYRQTSQLKALSLDTIKAINWGAGAASGFSGRYVVSGADALHVGAFSVGLANELERAGFRTAYEETLVRFVGEYRAKNMRWATARIHVATGAWIDECRHVPGAVEVAWADPRTAEERNEAETLRVAIIEALHRARRKDLAERIDYDLMGVLAADPAVDPYIGLGANRLVEIGGPAAVFILPPRASPAKMKGPRRRPAAPR